MKTKISKIICSLFLFFVSASIISGSDNFYAYHTKVQHSSTDYLGKYSDLIVVINDLGKLEFTRQTGYQPRWRTETGDFLLDDFFPGRDNDYVFYYNYVRLMEESPEKIVVHWRYIPDIKTLDRSIAEKDPLNSHGFLGVVHELFTIYPDGKVERCIMEATGTDYDQWTDPNRRITQTVELKNAGINYGKVNWGRADEEEEEGDEDDSAAKALEESVVNLKGLVEPKMHWRMDEGIFEHEGLVVEEISELESMIEGINVLYTKGVSGTALAFDGYYSGITVNKSADINDNFTIEAWIALDVYPYNEAPIIHQSKNLGEEGYYFGIDPYGNLLFRIDGNEVKSDDNLPLYKWQQVAVTVGKNKINLYQNGNLIKSADFNGKISGLGESIKIGLNSEKQSCSDYVRTPQQNIPFIFGIQGALDELRIYDKNLTEAQIKENYGRFRPDDITSPIPKGVLPGEIGVAEEFGAYYKNLKFQALWDDLWRKLEDDVVVKFDNMPTSVVYWRGANYAANWITEKNQWMSDQSSEIWGTHGCSEHMADKQTRHSFARIIENTPARVVIHWRYPCVDVGYICDSRVNWSDEYHTIYPDGTGIRKVHWNKGYNQPGFQDIQFFTNPGETALDVVDLQAMDVANINGDVEKLKWAKPNIVPEITIEDATIELLKSKSEYKIFVIFQGGNITPWGAVEQSAYTDDPFAGPWNHWPMHFVPSDGRFAVDHDRVTHFALGANDWAPEYGSMVHYGFTKQPIETVIPRAKFWQNPPDLKIIDGAENKGFNKDEKAYHLKALGETISFKIVASDESPVINPAFVISNWSGSKVTTVMVNGKIVESGSNLRQGLTRDSDGKLVKVIWLEVNSNEETDIVIKNK